jgi:pimeloyl-ACP methyl ester carboxylesterase
MGKRRPVRRRLGRIALVLIAVFAVVLSTGLAYQTVARERDESRFPPPGQLVDVGGFDLHLNRMGGGTDSPTVVLEHGGGGLSAQWGWVQPGVATFSPVVAYDRPGMGWSEQAPEGAIILATGVDYRRLGWAFVVGAGNSAGQAAIHLADHGAVVTILARGIDLRETMSEYLVHEIEQAPRITVRTRTTLIAVHGEGRLETIALRGPDAVTDEQADAVFVMIGAHPHTTWLPHTIARDTSGYVLTGTNLPPESWPEERPPFPHETSLPGVFAVRDVRAGSLKRVASAVGEGSLCVQQIHQYLSLTRHPGASP